MWGGEVGVEVEVGGGRAVTDDGLNDWLVRCRCWRWWWRRVGMNCELWIFRFVCVRAMGRWAVCNHAVGAMDGRREGRSAGGVWYGENGSSGNRSSTAS